MIFTRMKNKKHALKKLQDNLIALKQSNITFRQFPYLVRQWRLWLQVTRNFAMIEGSRVKGLKMYLSIFEGFPRPNTGLKNKLPPETDQSS
jgi:hypothetical protein